MLASPGLLSKCFFITKGRSKVDESSCYKEALTIGRLHVCDYTDAEFFSLIRVLAKGARTGLEIALAVDMQNKAAQSCCAMAKSAISSPREGKLLRC
jgi:hypothetical protein